MMANMENDKINQFELNIVLKEKYREQLKKKHFNYRKIIRNKRQIQFQDYNLITFKKEYHIEINPLSANINFITLPETYNTKIIHTHNLKIYYENKLVEPLESNNKKLARLNNIYRIDLSNFILKKINECFKNIEVKKSKLYKKEIINKLKARIFKYLGELKKYYFNKYCLYLEDKVLGEYNEKDFFKYENELHKERKKVLRYILKKDYDSINYIAELDSWIGLLIESRYEQLVAIELPKDDLQIKKKYHRTIKIKTEEPYQGCALIRIRQNFKSILFGESAEFLMRVPRYQNASTYYEVYPPKNTRISKVRSSSEDISNCNIFMSKLDNPIKKNRVINFKEKFDERFVVHIPREDISGINIPNFFLTLKPIKMVRMWVFISLLLGILSLIFMVFLVFNNFFRCFDINTVIFKDGLKYIIPLVYGLIIGNNLLIQEPKFLWKNTIYFSIFIIFSGTICYCIFLISI